MMSALFARSAFATASTLGAISATRAAAFGHVCVSHISQMISAVFVDSHDTVAGPWEERVASASGSAWRNGTTRRRRRKRTRTGQPAREPFHEHVFRVTDG